MGLTAQEYVDKILSVLDIFKTQILSISPTSEVETRYITSEKADQEQWKGYLTVDGKVDMWLITIGRVTGENQENSDAPMGTFNKFVSITIDYFADYHHGLDVTKDEDTGEEINTNTEHEFQKKFLAFDFFLEKNRNNCLLPNCQIISWTAPVGIKNFTTGATHIIKFTIELKFLDLR